MLWHRRSRWLQEGEHVRQQPQEERHELRRGEARAVLVTLLGLVAQQAVQLVMLVGLELARLAVH